jgi:hypothetical protein
MARPLHAGVRRACAGLAFCLVFALAVAAPARADEYDARRAGHPLRVVAYVVHPIGVALDWLLFRPAHWVVSQPVLNHVFGHDVDEEPQR